MANTLLGLTGVVYGTIGDAQIIVENIRETFSGSVEELTDGDGDIVAAVVHGDKGELTMDFVLRNGAAASYLLARGAELTLPTSEADMADGETLYLVSWEKSKSKGGWLSGSLTANYYPDFS